MAAAGGPLIGVLALQGGFQAHERVLRRLGARVREVRVPADLEGVDGLVIPGGETTTMSLGVERDGLAVAARQGRMLAVAFHSELGDDDRLHRQLLEWASDPPF